MVELGDERDPVRIPPGHHAQHPQRGGHRVAATLDRELHDLGITRYDIEVVARQSAGL